jgi:hypothetical protein
MKFVSIMLYYSEKIRTALLIFIIFFIEDKFKKRKDFLVFNFNLKKMLG